MATLVEAARQDPVKPQFLSTDLGPPEISHDAVEFLIDGYNRLVENLLHPKATASSIEFAYSRLLGTRGNVCRLCPPSEMNRMTRRILRDWQTAEVRLRDYLGKVQHLAEVVEIAQRVEDGWADSMERYLNSLCMRLESSEIPDQLGILKGIDAVGLHLAQREIFELSHTFSIPLENTRAVKLRVRLLSLFLMLHRCRFDAAYPAIRSYRNTFRIDDPGAYPWWFVDQSLTEKQLAWTYRRIPRESLDWRF